MSSSTLAPNPFRTFTAPRPPASTSTTLTSLLAQANSLSHAADARGYDAELPQIRFGMDEIERMSESVAGRGKGKKTSRGEG
jgi:nuclear pore complex protein Nup93